MIRKCFVFAAALLLAPCAAQAGFVVTSNGDLVLRDPGSPGGSEGPPITDIESLDFGGNSIGFVDQDVNGPQAVGNLVRSITFSNIGGAIKSPSGTVDPIVLPDGRVAGLITVLEGRIFEQVDVGGILLRSTVRFTLGTAFVVAVEGTSIVDDLVAGAGANPDVLTTAKIVASYNLLAPETVLSGDPLGAGSPLGGVVEPAAFVNTSSVNTGIATNTAAVLLFGEGAGAINTDFLSNVDPVNPLIGSDAKKGTEGFLVNPNLNLNVSDNQGESEYDNFKSVIDAFAAAGGVGPFTNDFDTDFAPNGFSTTGDLFFNSVAGRATTIHTIVPEPATYAAFAAIGLMAVRRRRNKK